MYAAHLRLIRKLLADFILAVIQHFALACFRFVTIHAFDRRIDRLLMAKTACIDTAS